MSSTLTLRYGQNGTNNQNNMTTKENETTQKPAAEANDAGEKKYTNNYGARNLISRNNKRPSSSRSDANDDNRDNFAPRVSREREPRVERDNNRDNNRNERNEQPRDSMPEPQAPNGNNHNDDADYDDSSAVKANGEGKILELKSLKSKNAEGLVDIAREHGLDNIGDFGRQDIIYHILKNFSDQHPDNNIVGEGVLEVLPDGFGFLRSHETNYFPGSDDIYVSPSQIKRFGLRTGDTVKGQIRAPKKGERYFALLRVSDVNFDTPEKIRNRVLFDDLTPLYPQKKLQLEEDKPVNGDISTRVIDMISPLGKGQRALIVAPPRTGKTSLMQNIAHAITSNHPEVVLMVLLIDERPEEVTDMARSVKGEVVSSTFD